MKTDHKHAVQLTDNEDIIILNEFLESSCSSQELHDRRTSRFSQVLETDREKENNKYLTLNIFILRFL